MIPLLEKTRPKIVETTIIITVLTLVCLAGSLLIFPEVFASHNLFFDLTHNKNTFGYSPLFLKNPEVKQNCLAALADKVLLDYCTTTLGTL